MSSTRIEARLRAVEKMLASPRPFELLMGEGQIETISVLEEGTPGIPLKLAAPV